MSHAASVSAHLVLFAPAMLDTPQRVDGHFSSSNKPPYLELYRDALLVREIRAILTITKR
jgi:hypothetical protein